MSALVSKWNAVKQKVAAEEEAERQREEEQWDPGALEKKRQREVEAWAAQQAAAGAAADNPNFVPLPTDWRAALLGSSEEKAAKASSSSSSSKKAAKAAARAAAKAAAAASMTTAAAAGGSQEAGWPTHSKTRPDLAALSVDLPPGWEAMWDKASGDIYYGNPTTKVRG
jgi:hypothetical protein